MEHIIKFYQPQDEKLPTKLRLVIDEHTYVMYDWILDFGYDFCFINCTESQSLSLTQDILKQLAPDEEVIFLGLINQKDSRFAGGTTVRVLFKKKFSYVK